MFGSKTNLVHAVLETEGKQWREWFIASVEAGGGDAQTKLTRIFPALKDWFGEERFYGCPFINAVGEHDKDQKQFRAIAMKHKKVVLAYIEKLAGEMGAAEPEVLAHQLGLSDRRRHRRGDGVARSRRRRHRGPRRLLAVAAVEAEEAETRGHSAGAADGGVTRDCSAAELKGGGREFWDLQLAEAPGDACPSDGDGLNLEPASDRGGQKQRHETAGRADGERHLVGPVGHLGNNALDHGIPRHRNPTPNASKFLVQTEALHAIHRTWSAGVSDRPQSGHPCRPFPPSPVVPA